MNTRLPGARVLNRAMTESEGQEVVKLDVLPVAGSQRLRVSFESVNSNWRQGVWLATDGILRVNEVEAPQLVLWQDTAPAVVDVDVIETDGILRFHNVWDSGRARGHHESHSATSGMLVEPAGEDTYRFRCNDIGYNPEFDKLVFTIGISPSLSA